MPPSRKTIVPRTHPCQNCRTAKLRCSGNQFGCDRCLKKSLKCGGPALTLKQEESKARKGSKDTRGIRPRSGNPGPRRRHTSDEPRPGTSAVPGCTVPEPQPDFSNTEGTKNVLYIPAPVPSYIVSVSSGSRINDTELESPGHHDDSGGMNRGYNDVLPDRGLENWDGHRNNFSSEDMRHASHSGIYGSHPQPIFNQYLGIPVGTSVSISSRYQLNASIPGPDLASVQFQSDPHQGGRDENYQRNYGNAFAHLGYPTNSGFLSGSGMP